MTNFRDERYHDQQLICLVKQLNDRDQLHILEGAFSIEDSLGELRRAQRRRLFDVELTFSNLSIVVETKVDSDENGRWDKERWDKEWQTERIVRESSSCGYLEAKKEFRFITYGTSEFYTKPYNAGPASPKFVHIGLECMINLGESATKVLPPCQERKEWVRLMKIEKEKRSKSIQLLRVFSEFRTDYLDIHCDNDFPNNRFTFCTPELAFPALSLLAQTWNGSEYGRRFGKLALYPISRMSPTVPDSVLNFWGMRKERQTIASSIVGNREPRLYFEINEDFNLNLKTQDLDLDTDKQQSIRECLGSVEWKRLNSKGQPRSYKQGALVLYEIDFGFLENLPDMPQVVNKLGETVEAVVEALP